MILERNETPEELAFCTNFSANTGSRMKSTKSTAFSRILSGNAKTGDRTGSDFVTFPIRHWNMRQISCVQPMNCMRNWRTAMFPIMLRWRT